MTTLCIVTAAHRGNLTWMEELGDSIAALELPDGWEVVWAVQQDEESTKELVELVERYPFGAYGCNGRTLGVAVTRNIALTRVPHADFVTNIDCDDRILPAFRASIDAMSDPNVIWAQGAVEDLLEDGSTVVVPPRPVGPCSPGAVSELWVAGERLPIHTIGFLARALHWRAIGGWVAGPTMSDDTFEVGCESQYVLEVNAGWTRAHGVMAGQRVKIEGI